MKKKGEKGPLLVVGRGSELLHSWEIWVVEVVVVGFFCDLKIGKTPRTPCILELFRDDPVKHRPVVLHRVRRVVLQPRDHLLVARVRAVLATPDVLRGVRSCQERGSSLGISQFLPNLGSLTMFMFGP